MEKIDIMGLVRTAKRKGYDNTGRLTERLAAIIDRNKAYVARRTARGTRTPTDIAMEEDNEVLAMAIVMLDSKQ